MAEHTNFLELLKKDPIQDKNDTFSIKEMLNDNWDKLDDFCFIQNEETESLKNTQAIHETAIDGIKEEINTPEFSTTELTALEQIQSVMDSYGGIAEFIASGSTLFQAVVNGDFANGTTGWGASGATLSVSNKVLSVTGNGTQVFNSCFQTLPIKGLTNEKIFIKTRVRATNIDATSILILLRDGTSGTVIAQNLISTPAQGQWYDLVLVGIVESNTVNNLTLIIQTNYADSATANGKVMEVEGDWKKGGGVFAIPLTGTPYENLTVDEINPRIGTYWERLKSAEKFGVSGRGRNLVKPIRDFELGTIGAIDGVDQPSTIRIRTKYIRIKGNTPYTHFRNNSAWENQSRFHWYDKNFNWLGSSAILNTATSPVSAYFYRTAFAKNDNSTITLPESIDAQPMLNEGETALPYEPFQGSTAKVTCTDPTKFDLAELPNGVANSLEFKNGKYRAVKRVQRYVLQSGDVASISTAGVNVDRATILLSRFTGVATQTLNVNGSFVVTNFLKETSVATQGDWDKLENINAFGTSTGDLRLFVPKDTYSTVEQARTALAGTVIYYELATPITIDEADFGEYGIEVEGVLLSNNDFTEFYIDNYDIFPSDLQIQYATNLAKAVDSLKNGVISLKEFQTMQNLVNLEFDARLTILE